MEPLWHTLLDFAITLINMILLILILFLSTKRYHQLVKTKQITEYDFNPISTIIEIQPLGADEWYEVTEFNQSKITTRNKTFNTTTSTFKIRIRNI